MSDKTYYVICADDCKYESMTKEQILTAIEQSLEQGYVSDPDSAVFSKFKEINANVTSQLWIGTEAEFNAISPAPTINTSVVRIGSDGILYLCTDDSSIPEVMPIEKGGTGATNAEEARSNLGIDSINTSYSTEEKLTGGTWIDGKPIYQRTFVGTVSKVNTNTDIGAIDGFESYVDMWGYLIKSDNIIVPLNRTFLTSSTNITSFNAHITAARGVNCRTYGDGYTGTVYITVQYTKSV